ncbi:hypothetical protein BDR05DRAFT_994917 [Suillus weaverae]|nr:hypothetical protein BDR05DRAFT_994917 [Suillus weaverae]
MVSTSEDENVRRVVSAPLAVAPSPTHCAMAIDVLCSVLLLELTTVTSSFRFTSQVAAKLQYQPRTGTRRTLLVMCMMHAILVVQTLTVWIYENLVGNTLAVWIYENLVGNTLAVWIYENLVGNTHTVWITRTLWGTPSPSWLTRTTLEENTLFTGDALVTVIVKTHFWDSHVLPTVKVLAIVGRLAADNYIIVTRNMQTAKLSTTAYIDTPSVMSPGDFGTTSGRIKGL